MLVDIFSYLVSLSFHLLRGCQGTFCDSNKQGKQQHRHDMGLTTPVVVLGLHQVKACGLLAEQAGYLRARPAPRDVWGAKLHRDVNVNVPNTLQIVAIITKNPKT